MKCLLLLSCAIAYASAACTRNWSYDYDASNGPLHWGTLPGLSLCFNGTRQTPINIDRATSNLTTYPPMSFSGGVNTTDWTFSNSGHHVQAKPIMDVWLRGGPLDSTKTYKLFNVHLHWGNSTSPASEHALDGQRTTGEIHIVTYDNQFSSIRGAVGSGNGDAIYVFAILFRADSGQTADTGLTNLAETCSNLTYCEDSVVGNFDFSSMYTDLDLQQYFTYAGSQTSPVCGEFVSWIVANRVQYVSPAVIDGLMSVRTGINATDPGRTIFGNHRPLQLVNGRTIGRSFEFSGSMSTQMSTNMCILFASLMATLMLRN